MTATPTVDWGHELAEQLDFHWSAFVRPHLDGLGDDEYRWEPVPGMWSIRRRQDSTAPMQAGAGPAVIEFAVPEPDPPPATTIAWRLAHLCIVFGERAANHFGAPPVSSEGTDWPLDAAGALALLDRCYASWSGGVRALDAAGLAAPCGPSEGPYAEYPMAALVLHINREAIHHAAEILVLRDLYRSAGGGSIGHR
jgi:hypothetical protein